MTGSNFAYLAAWLAELAGKADGNKTKAKKETARKEWLRVVLQTQENRC